MRSGRKTISLIFLIIFLVASQLFAARGSSNSLHIVAEVPENYGVAFPDNAIRFGDFVFEVEFKIDTELELENKEGKALITEDTISIGEIKPGLDSFNFTLVYYGNQSKPYRSEITVDPNVVWVLEGVNQLVNVPIKISLVKNEACDNDIICISTRDGQSYIEIPPSGPREGVPVLDVDISWDGARDLIPGKYTTELKLDMRIV